MARYYLDPDLRITGIVEDSHVGAWLVPHGEDISGPNNKLLFLGMVKADQELKIPVPGGANHGQVTIRIRKYGWLPMEFQWPMPPDDEALINILQIPDGVLHAER